MNRSLHIGLVAQGGPGWAGGAEYIRNLLRALTGHAQVKALTILCAEAQVASWQPGTADEYKVFGVHQPTSNSILGRLLKRPNAAFGSAVGRAHCDFVYPFTYDNVSNVGVTLPLGDALGNCRWAGWIPDFQHRYLPQLFSEKEMNRRERGMVALVEEAPRVVLSSETAAADFRRFFPMHESKAEVLRFATYPHADWYADFNEDLGWLPPRFFLVSNQFWKHKNHLVLFEALRILAARGVRPAVVCTGALADFRDADFSNVILQTIHRSGLTRQVMLLGLVARRTQIELMRRCLAVVQPSLFEGWSTVVEDARVLGRPSILSDLDVHREQAPPGARYFPRADAEALASALAEAWETLTPGIDREAETNARALANTAVIRVGGRFMEIAQAAGA